MCVSGILLSTHTKIRLQIYAKTWINLTYYMKSKKAVVRVYIPYSSVHMT